MLRAVMICRSQTPPMWLADGMLSWNSIQSQLRSKRKWRTRDRSTDDSAFSNSFLAPTRLVPWSHLSVRTGPCRFMKRRNALMNESVSREADTSKWMAWLDSHVNSHVNSTPYLFNSLRPSFITNGPK